MDRSPPPDDDYGFFAPPPRTADGPPPGAPNDLPTTLSPDERLLLAGGARTSWQNMSGARPQRPGFFASVGIGLQLLPACWYVLGQRRALAALALASAVLSGVVAVGFAFATGGLTKEDSSVGTFALGAPCALLLTTIGIVSQAVVIDAATEVFDGRRTPLRASWNRVLTLLPRFVIFAVLYSLERVATALLRSWIGRWLGSLVADLIDAAWDFAVYLAIPVILYEDLDVLPAVRRSANLVAHRFGTAVAARAALSVGLFVLALPLLLVVVLVAMYWLLVGVILAIVLAAAYVGIAGAMNGILAAAIYRYAVTGETAPGFTPTLLSAPFSA